MRSSIPLLFTCSGCSNAGQLANSVALALDRQGSAEMSCLAGVGARKKHFLKKLDEREVWVIDGCPIECSLGVFQAIERKVDVHIRLHDLGIKKNHPLPEGERFDRLVGQVLKGVEEEKSKREHSRGPEEQL